MSAEANFFELVRIARAHDLAQFRAFGRFFDGWARVKSDLLGGLDGMRRGVDSLRAQNILIFDSLIKIALAKTEAEAGDPGRAVAILDDALATADRAGHRAFEAELAPGARRTPVETRPRQPRACGRSLPDRHRGREPARRAQLRTARGAGAGEALPIDRPPRRSPRRPRAGARRLCADTGNARDRRGAGVARGAGDDGRGQSWRPRIGSG